MDRLRGGDPRDRQLRPRRVVPNDEFTEHHSTRPTSGSAPAPASASGGSPAPGRRPPPSAPRPPATPSPPPASPAADIDLIVCATVTPDLMCPANACLIQAALGLPPDPGVRRRRRLLRVPLRPVGRPAVRPHRGRPHALVVGAEVLSRTLDFTDRNTCILFGDGAGAVVLPGRRSAPPASASVRLYSDGARQELIQVPSQVTPEPAAGAGHAAAARYLRMNGREVFRFAVTR